MNTEVEIELLKHSDIQKKQDIISLTALLNSNQVRIALIENNQVQHQADLNSVKAEIVKNTEQLDVITATLTEFKGAIKTFKALGDAFKVLMAIVVPLAAFVGWLLSHLNILK